MLLPMHMEAVLMAIMTRHLHFKQSQEVGCQLRIIGLLQVLEVLLQQMETTVVQTRQWKCPNSAILTISLTPHTCHHTTVNGILTHWILWRIPIQLMVITLTLEMVIWSPFSRPQCLELGGTQVSKNWEALAPPIFWGMFLLSLKTPHFSQKIEQSNYYCHVCCLCFIVQWAQVVPEVHALQALAQFNCGNSF